MNAIGLKYVGKREEGISVMLFKSYKTVKISKITPYRFTSRDLVTQEAINYYNKLSKLGLSVITDEADFIIGSKRKLEVRKEPLAAEVDVQLDPTQAPKTPEDSMSDELNNNQVDLANTDNSQNVNSDDNKDSDDNEDDISITPASNPDEFLVDKEAIKAMSSGEISEYLEMNFNKDQLKSLINELGLDISVGRKGVPSLVGEIVANVELDNLIAYLTK